MGVIKNLMVRIGADARGYIGGMKAAGSATGKAADIVRKHTTSIKKTVSGGFSASGMSLKDYTATVAKTTQDYNEATQNAERLKDKLDQMKDVYTLVKEATEGLDLSKSFEESRVEAEKALTEIEAKRKKVEADLASVSSTPKGDNSKKAEKLRAELDALGIRSVFAVKRLEHLDEVAEALGDENIGYASTAGLKELEGQITATQNEMNTMNIRAEEAKRKLYSMGSGVSAWELIKKKIGEVKTAAREIPAAFSAIRTDPNEVIASGLIRLGNSLKLIPANLLGTVSDGLHRVANGIRAIPEIPGRIWNGIKRIGAGAAQFALGGVKKLGSSLLKLGSSALRGIITLPGMLRRIGSSASGSCGGLSRMVASIRNIGIASLGMRVAGGMFGRMRSIISGYIQQNEALNASIESMKNQMGEALLPAINMVMAAMQSLMPIVTALSAGITSVMQALFGNVVKTTSAIKSAGSAASKSLELYGFDQITKANEESGGGGTGSTGNTGIAATQSALVDKLVGWIQKLKAAFVAGDWNKVGAVLSDGIKSVLAKANDIVVNTDWLKIGQSIRSFVVGIDWKGILTGLAEGLGAIVGGLSALIWGLIGPAWGKVVEWWKENAYKDGEFTMKGLLNGIGKVFVNIGNWIKENIFDPFINGFRKAFKIHSPSVVMEEHGGFLIGGLLNGITAWWEKIKAFFGTALPNLSGTVSEAFSRLKNSVSDIWKNGIVPAIKGPVNSIISCINGMVSGVVSGINSLIKALNKLSFDVPDWVPEIGGKTFGFNLKTISAPQIPMLGRGGIVNGATAIIAGEQGKEAIVPLERNTEWKKQIADIIREGQTQGGGPGGSAVIQIFLGHRKVTEFFIRDINQMTRENGVCPIHV